MSSKPQIDFSNPKDLIWKGPSEELKPGQIRISLADSLPHLAPVAYTHEFEELGPESPIPWMATDGKKVMINPENLKDMSQPFWIFGYVHELVHIMRGHVFQKGNAFREGFNMKVYEWSVECATNYVTKELLGVDPPTFVMYDSKYDGMTELEIYNKVMENEAEKKKREDEVGERSKPKGPVNKAPKGEEREDEEIEDEGGDGSGGEGEEGKEGKEGKEGSGGKDGKPNEKEGFSLPEHGNWGTMTEKEYKETKEEVLGAISRAIIEAQSHTTGGEAAQYERMYNDMVDQLPWTAILEKYMTKEQQYNYDFTQPDSTYYGTLGNEILMPSIREYEDRLKVEKIIFAIDTSGSISDGILSKCMAEAKKLDSLGNYECYIMFCSTEVHSVIPLENWKDAIPQGGGGGDLRPVFHEIKKRYDDDVKLLVFMTDGYEEFPKTRPEFPVLWVNFGSPSQEQFPKNICTDIINYSAHDLQRSFNLSPTSVRRMHTGIDIDKTI